jgi:monovalent cation:H+ antiporter-2, CPA2 family
VDGGLVANLTLALLLAFVGGSIAVRLGQSAMVGYIGGGILIGPYTPGLIADQAAVEALAEVGIIFLLFAVGVQLSVKDLLQAGRIATIGAAIQVVAMIAVGWLVALALGWPTLEGLFFGSVISNSSSTVLGKLLAERGETQSEHGRLGIAWSTIQDLSTILLVVILSSLALGADGGPLQVLIATGKAAILLVIVVPLGLRVLPWMLERVLILRTREMFILAVAIVAFGTAYLASLFGVSLALGAFLAGLMVGETDHSHQVFREVVPLRDVFTGLFFVSVGMLVDPLFILTSAPLVLLTVALIVLVKGGMIAVVARYLGATPRTSVLTGIGLAQSAEFSFLLARVGADLGTVTGSVFNLMLVGSAISIMLAPKLHKLGQPLARRVGLHTVVDDSDGMALPGIPAPDRAEEPPRGRRFAVICGYGRVGAIVARALERRGFQYVVVEEDPRIVREIRKQGVSALVGAADNPILLERAGVASARVLVVAIPDAIATRLIVEYSREINPTVDIVARSHSVEEMRLLREQGVREAIVGELELALEITRHTLTRFGVSSTEVFQIVRGLREQASSDDA